MMLSNNDFCEYISQIAVKSMLYEVSATPKPGLVDRNNSGAHKDMNFFTFMASSASLGPTFYKCALAGMEFDNEDMKLLLKCIRPIGLEGERRMFEATGGVNTHKGLIFSLGIISSAAAFIYKNTQNLNIDIDELSDLTMKMTEGITEQELKNIGRKDKLTKGERLYIEYGVKGIRGEVEKGFPTAREKGLSLLEELMSTENHNINDCLVQVLLNLMTEAEDSNIMGRHDLDTLDYVRKEACKTLRLGGMFTEQGKEKIFNMDKDFIRKNISPGGSADLLAVTIMFLQLKEPRYLSI